MRTITVEKRGWIGRRKKTSQVPESWDELTTEQYMMIVCSLLGKSTVKDYYSTLLGIPFSVFELSDSFVQYNLQQMLEWIGEGKAEANRFFIPSIEGLKAPDDMLGNITLQQFMTVDTFFSYHAHSITEECPFGDIQLLCQFVAALYLRKNERYYVASARRTIFDWPGQNEEVVDLGKNTDMLMKRADRVRMYGIHVNWLMVKSWLSRIYPLLFPQGDEKETPVRNAWLKTFDSFVGDDVAHMDDYRNMACLDAFRVMSKRIKDSIMKK